MIISIIHIQIQIGMYVLNMLKKLDLVLVNILSPSQDFRLVGRPRGGSSFLLQKSRNGFVESVPAFHFLKGRSVVAMKVDDRRECCGKGFDNVESL